MRGHLKRRCREVEARDAAGTEPRERQRVGADVAVEMHDVEGVDAAEARKIEAHRVGKLGGIGSVLLELVALFVMGHPAVPVGKVDSLVIAHRAIVPHRSARPTLTYSLRMATDGGEPVSHLRAELRRVRRDGETTES